MSLDPRRLAEAGRRETRALLALLILTALYWGLQYHPFLLPNNDYYSFELTAQSLGSLELPRSFKRLPAFPALMALVAPAVPGQAPWMHAALLLNAAFGLGALGLLFVYARRCFAPGAVLVPLLLSTTVQFHAMGLQPLVEPSLGFFVLLTFVLHQRRSAWQYATAFAVGLGRAEAATLIPLLFLANWQEDRRFWHHGVRAGLAASGILVWTGLGSLYGSGQSFYLELMEGMGWHPSPGFYWRLLREDFAFLYSPDPLLNVALLTATSVPLALGIASGLRRFRRESILMLAFFVVSASVVVVFGVNKPRYVYPTFWIPLLFCGHGLVRLCELVSQRLEARRPRATGLAVVAVAGWLACLAAGLAFMQTRAHLFPPALDAAYALGCVALAALALRPLAGSAARLAVVALLLAFLSATITSGLARKKTALKDIHDANYGSWLLAGWLHENAAPEDRIILLGKKHIQHLRPIEKHRLRNFSKVEARDVPSLVTFMREGGWTLVAWTHRGEAKNPSAKWYYRTLNVGLAESFRSGGPVEGFEHVATLAVPGDVDESDVQIYRLAP